MASMMEPIDVTIIVSPPESAISDIVGAHKKNHPPQSRRDRKRATDRLAQREHRKRQKMYVQELEARLEVLRRDNSRDQVKVLWRENEQLRQELKSLRAFFSTVESLVATLANHPSTRGQPSDRNTNPDASEKSEIHRNPTAGSDTLQTDITDNMHASDDRPQAEADFQQSPKSSDGAAPDNALANRHGAVYSEDGTNQASLQAFNSNINFTWSEHAPSDRQPDLLLQTVGETPSWLDNLFATGSLSPSGPFDDLGNLFDPTCSQFVGACLTQDSNADVQAAAQNISNIVPLQPQRTSAEESSTGKPTSQTPLQEGSRSPTSSSTSKVEIQIHRSHSHVLMPPLPQDIYVHEIIERARSNACSRRVLLAAPTLADFLVDNPTNVLSADLKRYLEPVRRSRRTAEYLGTYWVTYLLLRWQVNQSSESFERIPSWFRPTEMQMHMPHPIGIDFIAWPLLRDELIKMSHSDPDQVHEVLTNVGVYLELNLEITNGQSFMDEQALNMTICDIRNWKLREGFFDVYPQWRELFESFTSYSSA